MIIYFQECSQFHAGEVLPALRSKGRNKLFDEKGVFGRVCRHDFPKSLLNIKHGERYSTFFITSANEVPYIYSTGLDVSIELVYNILFYNFLGFPIQFMS
jgi:hypothetical protein